MKRRLLKLGLLLLIGAIINVAVAWGCVRGDYQQREVDDGVPPSAMNAIERSAPRQWVMNRDSGWRWCSFGVVYDMADGSLPVEGQIQLYGHAVGIVPGPAPESAAILRAGWPMRSFQYSMFGKVSFKNPPITYSNALSIGWGGWPLPSAPLWPGFTINTIFYAAILWLLCAAPGFVRRRIRARRGQCPACAYPIGTSDVCTECGKPISIPRLMEQRA